MGYFYIYYSISELSLHKSFINPRLVILLGLAILSIVAYMTIGANGKWAFIIPFRGVKLAVMLLVAYAIAVSSVLFQTITHNRILTPSIMGFDALYVLIQTIVIYVAGSQAAGQWSPVWRFIIEVVVMTGFTCWLFQWLFIRSGKSLHLVMLVGIIFGLLFRSLSGFVGRIIDPNEFLYLQDRLFASFNSIKTDLLGISFIIVILATVLIGWRLRRTYDVLILGRETAINLGVAYRSVIMQSLIFIAILVAVSTALVGPITFFGLLASNLAYMFMRTDKHYLTLPGAVLISIILLVGGQTILERVLQLNTAVSVVIEFVGGLMFILLVVKKVKQ